jgi:hypothetical protein
MTLLARLKPYLRWLILLAVVFFLLNTLYRHWREVASLRISAAGIACLTIALGITLLAHLFAGYVWAWILRSLAHRVPGEWGAKVYLKTNIAKYLPGNIWHFYGRISAASKIGIRAEVATVSVLLEPLLMAAAACLLGLVTLQPTIVPFQILPWIASIAVLATVHPKILNPLLKQVGNLKKNAVALRIRQYPLVPLLGELGFLGLRSLGFIFTTLAVMPIQGADFPVLIGAFAWAWLLGFIIPGLPGGIGVFEAVAIALLRQHFSAGYVLSAVALYRLINTIAEGMGASLVVLDEQRDC